MRKDQAALTLQFLAFSRFEPHAFSLWIMSPYISTYAFFKQDALGTNGFAYGRTSKAPSSRGMIAVDRVSSGRWGELDNLTVGRGDQEVRRR